MYLTLDSGLSSYNRSIIINACDVRTYENSETERTWSRTVPLTSLQARALDTFS